MGLVKDAPHQELTYKVIGAAMAVHNELGPGHREGVYQRALATKLRSEGLLVEVDRPIEIWFEGVLVGILYPDLVVETVLPVELKAVSHLMTDDEIAQMIAYLVGMGSPVGLLINFGRPRLEFRRIFPPRKVTDRQTLMKRALHAQQSKRPK